MDTIDALLKEGINAHRNGDLAQAERLYQQALELDTDNASAHNNLGFVLGQQQQWPEALSHLRTALRLNPYMSMAHSNLGQVLVATGQVEEGLLHLEEAVKYDPDNITAWDNLARIRLLLGQYEGAEYAAMRALKLRPVDAHLLTRLGTTIAAQKRFNEALQFYQQAIELDHRHVEAWAQLGITLYLRNDLGSAREALQTAISLNANDINALRHLALVELGLGNRAGAIAQFERLLALQPDEDHSRIDLAVLLLSSQKGDLALNHLDRINSPLRDTSKFRFYQALALQQTGHATAAQTLLQDLAELDGDDYGEKARQLLYTA